MSKSASQFSVELLGRSTFKMSLASSVLLDFLWGMCGGCGWGVFCLFLFYF